MKNDRLAILLLIASGVVGIIVGTLVMAKYGMVIGFIAGCVPPVIVAEILGKARNGI